MILEGVIFPQYETRFTYTDIKIMFISTQRDSENENVLFETQNTRYGWAYACSQAACSTKANESNGAGARRANPATKGRGRMWNLIIIYEVSLSSFFDTGLKVGSTGVRK